MTLVLLVLAILWAAVLIPPALRARAESRPGDSISAFRRQLAVLRRAGPPTSRSYGSDYGVAALHPRMSQRVATPMAQPYVGAHRPPSMRRTAQQRRRSILFTLAGTAGATLVLGAIPAFRALWAIHLLVDGLLVAYVALLVRQRTLAAERELKVRFLPGAHRVDPAWAGGQASLLRRSAT